MQIGRMTRRLTLLACSVLSGGCVAINVGKPQVFTTEYPAELVASGPEKAVSCEPRENVSGRDSDDGRRILRIGLEGEVVVEQPVERCWERVSVEKQKKLAFGFMPAQAELFYRPQGSLMPMIGWKHTGEGDYKRGTDPRELVVAFYLGILWLPHSLLIEPFLPFECGSHHWGRQSSPSLLASVDRRTENEFPKVNYLAQFSDEERRKIGAWMWCDEKTHPQRNVASWFSHLGAFGFHKYCTYVVQGPERLDKRTRENPVTGRRMRSVEGPYRVALDLPECGFARTLNVPRGETAVDFDLGWLDTDDGFATGTVSFLLPRGGADAERNSDDLALLQAASRRSFPVRVQVRPAGRARAAASSAGVQQPQIIREIHHYHETTVVEEKTPAEAPWEIETVEPFGNGRGVYLVTIRDASKKAFEVEREVKPEIERLLREAFLAERPGVDASAARAFALPEFKGRTILFKGVAFSMQPASDGWRYDFDTQRGIIRIRVSEWMTAEEAKRWARENIEAIVKEKNVALEAGEAPPAGAVYRSLGESLENGVLSVEFEAVE